MLFEFRKFKCLFNVLAKGYGRSDRTRSDKTMRKKRTLIFLMVKPIKDEMCAP